ncbi:hypothetical protein QQP08_002970 [Theobroma cacao]|nr:hypothetical protein QQP08_002970 [Theobroma cacao]
MYCCLFLLTTSPISFSSQPTYLSHSFPLKHSVNSLFSFLIHFNVIFLSNSAFIRQLNKWVIEDLKVIIFSLWVAVFVGSLLNVGGRRW